MTLPPQRSSPEGPVRLQKAISAAGLMSRRAAEVLIAKGRVTIDGRRARLGDRVDPVRSVVEVDGARLPLAPHLITYLVNKPPGVISTTSDPMLRRRWWIWCLTFPGCGRWEGSTAGAKG